MWTAANRKSHERKGLRYPSDMTEAEWSLVKPVVDVPQRGQGRRRQVDLREVLNAVFYILETGCQWRALPRDLPPRSTVHDYFIRWQCDRTLVKLHHELYVQAREQAGKEASPTTAIVDSQSVKSAERGAKPRIRSVTMPARRSKGASAMRSSIRSA
jgi:transposase